MYRVMCSIKEYIDIAHFVLRDTPHTRLRDRYSVIRQMHIISARIYCPHTTSEILTYIRTILSLPDHSRGVVVEAGCFRGGSTAKFSLAANIAKRTLVVFDSFEGIPDNNESHEINIFGGKAEFRKGSYAASLEEVQENVKKYGNIESCRFIKGWFENTMPTFKEEIAAIYLDVDLASSTRTCIKYLYPLLEQGGALYSQDGHLPLVLELVNDDKFWLNEVGCSKPIIDGIWEKKLIRMVKTA